MLAIVTNLIVPTIEDSLPFYTRLGFAQTVGVPHPPDAPDAGEGAPRDTTERRGRSTTLANGHG